jgi:hypothetical protein
MTNSFVPNATIIDNKQTEGLMRYRFNQFIAAAKELSFAWNEDYVGEYPAYLPDFDQFVFDMEGMMIPKKLEDETGRQVEAMLLDGLEHLASVAVQNKDASSSWVRGVLKDAIADLDIINSVTVKGPSPWFESECRNIIRKYTDDIAAKEKASAAVLEQFKGHLEFIAQSCRSRAEQAMRIGAAVASCRDQLEKLGTLEKYAETIKEIAVKPFKKTD